MDVLLKQDWDLFSRYALNDAEVCVRYFESLSQQYEQLQGTKLLPVALSSIGLRLLVDEWKNRSAPLSRLDAVGKEEIIKLRWIEDSEKYKTDKEDVYYEELSWFIDFVTECYHGGRNEQYWFGPSFEDDWSDFDLSGAYPTAMALINLPKWREVRASSDPSDFEFGKFAFCCVDFEFPPETRYPTLPVRSDNGLIFPLKGRSYCSTPELEAARNLGCQFHIRHGVIIPTDDSCPVFAPYIKDAIAKRLQSKSKIENAFWKEVTNSCYGKTAQGLRDKRVFNIRKERNEPLRESRITNPFYAAFITSLVRAVVGEIINAIPPEKMVFSATTDGFITNATDEEMVAAQSGPLSRLFAMSREQLTGVPDVLTKKHFVRQVLGWKTRGQATLQPGDKHDVPNIVLAKTSIQPPRELREVSQQNDYCVDLFFDRTGETRVQIDTQTTLRDLIFFKADLVGKKTIRRLNMEFDFKRKPYSCVTAVGTTKGFREREYNHLAWSTKPWADFNEFKSFKEMWESHFKTKKLCLKNEAEFREFAEYFDMRNALPVSKRAYLAKDGNGDLKRLRRDLCRAFKAREIGFENYDKITARQFADVLNECGLRKYGVICERKNIESALRSGDFEPYCTPLNDRVLEVLKEVKARYPLVDVDQVLYQSEMPFNLIETLTTSCPFTDRLDKA
jgi:hypothetical protein